MNSKQFDEIVKRRGERIRAILASKAEEYARGDRLSNFKKAAAAMSCTPEKACIGFWMKHVVSLIDLTNDLDNGRNAKYEMWQEKIGDAINYLVLLEGLVCERMIRESADRVLTARKDQVRAK